MEIFAVVAALVSTVNLVLLIMVISKQNKPQSNEELSKLIEKTDKLAAENSAANKSVLDLLTAQNTAIVSQMETLRGGVSETLNGQQNMIERQLVKLENNFNQVRQDILSRLDSISKSNSESLDKINSTVNEKLQKTLDTKLANQNDTIVSQISKLGGGVRETLADQQNALDKRLHKLESDFNLIQNNILTSLETIRKSNSESLDKINDTVNEKLQKTLDDRINKSFEAVNQRLTEVYQGLGEMKSVAAGVSDLKNVLSNVKTRGILGEIQLEGILSEILAPEQYEAQVQVKPNSSERVDFAVKLPGADDGSCVYLPIDSKFPGDSYQNLLYAYETDTAEGIKQKRHTLETEIKRAAKSICDKYIIAPYTTDFAIMFLPFEGLYAEVVNMGLVEKLQHDYKVNIAGPSTMAAMLNSLHMGFRTLAIQKKSSEVWKILEGAKAEFENFGKTLEAVRNRLRQADDELDKLVGTRTRAINRKLKSVTVSSEQQPQLDVFDE